MSRKVPGGYRVPEEWHTEILNICEATGQISLEILNEAIDHYLCQITVKTAIKAF